MGAAGMSKRGGGQVLPPGNVEKCFSLQMLSKTLVYEVFMHNFEKMSSASGVFAPRPPPGSCPWTLRGDFGSSDPLIAHLWKKNPAGAHG